MKGLLLMSTAASSGGEVRKENWLPEEALMGGRGELPTPEDLGGGVVPAPWGSPSSSSALTPDARQVHRTESPLPPLCLCHVFHLTRKV